MRYRDIFVPLALTVSSLSVFTNAAYIERRSKPPHPVIQEFQDVIESDLELLTGFALMFDQVPHAKHYDYDFPGFEPQVRDYHTMLSRLNDLLTTAPNFGTSFTFPLSSIFGWPMCTQAGFDMFMNDKVNAQLKRILNTWAQFLESPASRSVLTRDPGGWFSPSAMETVPNFVEAYECDPDEEYFGFKSWDEFFRRKFRDGARPVDAPGDKAVINNACESLPFRVQHDVKEEDMFWLKGQPYSLKHMLDNDPLAAQFVGGTVFQSYLAGHYYHRWHSPVDGTIVKIKSVPGTYLAISPSLGFASTTNVNRLQMGLSQAFMSNVATRMIMFIQADNPDIGLMAFIAIGMAEASSCEATVKVGDRVKKGDQLGMFHYGGSTSCMIFRPETEIEFTEEVQNTVDKFPDGELVQVNKQIGVVRTRDAEGLFTGSSAQQQQWSA